MLRYLFRLTLFTVLVAVSLHFASAWFSDLIDRDYSVAISIYFFLLSAVFHYGLVRASAGRPAVFVRYYMGATTLKLFIHLGVLLVFAFLHREKLFPFAITFLCQYLLFTVFEVISAFRQENGPRGT